MFRKLFFIVTLLSLYSVVATAATSIFSLTPQGTLPTQVSGNSTVQAKYTVTNNVPYTIEASGLNYQGKNATPTGVTQNTSAQSTPTTCSDPFTLTPGGSCTLVLDITAKNLVNQAAIGGPKVCNTKYSAAYCSIPAANDRLNVTVSVPFNLVFANASPNFGNSFILQSIQGGQWASVFQLSDLGVFDGDLGSFAGGSCGDQLCIVAGTGVVSSELAPLLLQSTDGGESWTQSSIPGLPNKGSFSATSCAREICIAVGQDNGGTPIMAQTTDGGQTWTQPAIAGLPSNVSLPMASCYEDICIVGGIDQGTSKPVLAQSLNGGLSWAVVTVTGVDLGLFLSASCASNICVAAGSDYTQSIPMLAQSLDGGASWATQKVTGLPPSGSFSSVSCTATICVVTGNDSSDNPIVAQTTTAGVSWFIKSIFSDPGRVGQVSCYQDTCVIGGVDSTLLTQTTNAGSTWASVPLSLPGSSLGLVSCNSFSCVAGGASIIAGSDPTVVIAQTLDGGATWSVPSIDGLPAGLSLISAVAGG